MEEIQLALTTARTDQKNFGLWLKNWQVGQTLSALVSGQRPSGELVLRVGGMQITATADIPIQQGARLLLEVRQVEPQPVLRIIAGPAGNLPSESAGSVRLLGAAAPGLETVNALARLVTALQPAEGAARALPAEGMALVRQVLRSVARATQLAQPAGLKAAVANSGTFSEATLLQAVTAQGTNAQAAAGPVGDMKTSLARILAYVDARLERVNAVPTRAVDAAALLGLRQELDASLAAITTNQLASLPGDQGTQRNWAFSIPFQWQGEYRQLQLQLEREPRDVDDAESGERWRFQLSLELPRLGSLAVDARVAAGQLAVELISEQPAVRRLLQARAAVLETALANSGLTLSGLVSRAPASRLEPAPRVSSELDLRV